jgi:nucleotide-binding universal stress UspA family protein
MNPIHHILVPTDFELASDTALDHAIALARAFDARVTVLYVHEPVTTVYGGAPFMPMVDGADRAATAARAALAAMQHRRAAEWKNVACEFRLGKPWREIVDFAAREQVDLIAMGTHGREGVSRAVLGSVAERVVRQSPVPVLTVHFSGSGADQRARVPVERSGETSLSHHA